MEREGEGREKVGFRLLGRGSSFVALVSSRVRCAGAVARRAVARVMSRAEGKGKRRLHPPTRPVGSRPIFRPLEVIDTTIMVVTH